LLNKNALEVERSDQNQTKGTKREIVYIETHCLHVYYVCRINKNYKKLLSLQANVFVHKELIKKLMEKFPLYVQYFHVCKSCQ